MLGNRTVAHPERLAHVIYDAAGVCADIEKGGGCFELYHTALVYVAPWAFGQMPKTTYVYNYLTLSHD